MPLSEDEERILNQIEQRLYAQDPGSAHRLEATTLPRYLRRNCVWSAVAFLFGLVVLLASFSTSWLLGVVGFGMMTVSGIIGVKNLRRMGRHGLGLLAEELQRRGLGQRVGGVSRGRWRPRRGDS